MNVNEKNKKNNAWIILYINNITNDLYVVLTVVFKIYTSFYSACLYKLQGHWQNFSISLIATLKKYETTGDI